MKTLWMGVLIFATAMMAALGLPQVSVAQEVLTARLRGFEVVPSISTVGSGFFGGTVSNNETALDFELSYNNIESAVQQAHIHFGQKSVTGGIVIFLCTNLGNGPSGTPTCPSPSGTVMGTRTAADMVNLLGTSGQGIAPGEFAELLRAIRGGVAYADVTSMLHPTGELRGQIRSSQGVSDQ